MNITIVTLFPEMISSFFHESMIKRAQEKGRVTIDMVNLRDFANDTRGTVDDRPYGGGPGMIIKAEPILKAVSVIQSAYKSGEKKRTILTSPRGLLFSQKKARQYAKLDRLIICAGHYEGMDERVMDVFDEEISIGDYILTGGELPAAVIVDSVVRLLPGVLKKEDAVEVETLHNVPIEELIEAVGEDDYLKKLKNKGIKEVRLLEYPQYTRPSELNRKKVPTVLLSGNPKDINAWQLQQSYILTKKRRPDLLS